MTVRVFVAVEPPHEAKELLWEAMAPWRTRWPSIRWERPPKLHFTLRFLGEIPEERIEAVGQATRRAADGQGSFTASLGGVGWFPSPRRPRVIWVGLIHGAAELSVLQMRLEDELHRAGFGRDSRRFSPHLTVGRVRETVRVPLGEELEVPIIRFPVERLVVKQSTLAPGGSVYTDRESCLLRGQARKE